MAVVSVPQYRAVTGDNATVGTEVTARIEDATEIIGDYLGRTLEGGEHTERIKISSDGYGYPTACPIQSVAASADYDVWDEFTLRGVFPDDIPFVGWAYLDTDPGRGAVIGGRLGRGYDAEMPYGTITYVGGYGDGSDPNTPALPVDLRRAISRLAKALHDEYASDETGLPAGATRVQVGDVAVSYDLSTVATYIDDLVPGLTRSIRRFKLDRL